MAVPAAFRPGPATARGGHATMLGLQGRTILVGAELRIWLLGGFRAAVDGTPVEDESWRRSKARALVKRLALARGGGCTASS